MADSYLDIIARPEADTTASVLLSGLFEQLHLEFVARRLSTVGVSFPDAQFKLGLGKCLRLHGPNDVIASLAAMPWLDRASDYYRVGVPRDVPLDHKMYVVRRLQPKLSAAKVRRLVARGSVSEESGEQLLEGRQQLDAPYVQIKSGSSGQRFRLFFEQVPVEPSTARIDFNTYGFGKSIPWF